MLLFENVCKKSFCELCRRLGLVIKIEQTPSTLSMCKPITAVTLYVYSTFVFLYTHICTVETTDQSTTSVYHVILTAMHPRKET